ncbi:hypothetical protein ACFQT0_15690 [Hymenobacter humi]|uniref:DUF2064 domain-containing protein n=1 Tax=Hymenobacter humi TaxID=1411620 RepID=A0ABW2U8Z1_9BACT
MSKPQNDAQPKTAPGAHLLVFARVPALGQVKTRLAAGVGVEEALAIYQELLGITRSAIVASGVPTTVWLAGTAGPEPTPAEAQHWPEMAARCQQTGDLGQRMAAAFAAALPRAPSGWPSSAPTAPA